MFLQFPSEGHCCTQACYELNPLNCHNSEYEARGLSWLSHPKVCTYKVPPAGRITRDWKNTEMEEEIVAMKEVKEDRGKKETLIKWGLLSSIRERTEQGTAAKCQIWNWVRWRSRKHWLGYPSLVLAFPSGIITLQSEQERLMEGQS